jgi:hypothetical protein
MDQTNQAILRDGTAEDAIPQNESMIENKETVRLFNDVFFSRTAPPAIWDTWDPFPRLPVELRMSIWLLFLQRHRMIEVSIRAADDEDGTTYPGHDDDAQSRFYTHRNYLGRIVSGRGYTLYIKGRGYATSFSPLLWVNSEARQAALGFYRVHLPFPRQAGGQVLYLNPEHDVIYVRPEYPPPTVRLRIRPDTVLPDFLHDVRAYDPKDQGYVTYKSHFPAYLRPSLHLL